MCGGGGGWRGRGGGLNRLYVYTALVMDSIVVYESTKYRGVARPNILLKQAFLRCIIEYVHLAREIILIKYKPAPFHHSDKKKQLL